MKFREDLGQSLRWTGTATQGAPLREKVKSTGIIMGGFGFSVAHRALVNAGVITEPLRHTSADTHLGRAAGFATVALLATANTGGTGSSEAQIRLHTGLAAVAGAAALHQLGQALDKR
jgi:hypothetical protein